MTAEKMGPGDPEEPNKGGPLDTMSKLAELGLYFGMIGQLEQHPKLIKLDEETHQPGRIVQQSDIETAAGEILDEILSPFAPSIKEKGLTFEQARKSIINGYIKFKYPRIKGEIN